MKRITDPTFKYTPAVNTDLRKTFKRVIRERAAAEAAAEDKATQAVLERTDGLAEHHAVINANFAIRRASGK